MGVLNLLDDLSDLTIDFFLGYPFPSFAYTCDYSATQFPRPQVAAARWWFDAVPAACTGCRRRRRTRRRRRVTIILVSWIEKRSTGFLSVAGN
jgi:hypothetical protein